MVNYIDISPTISSETAVFPGDTPFSRRTDLDFAAGDKLRLSHITSSVHIGAHADAPSHYHSEGESIEKRELDFYIGKAQVIEVFCKRGERIVPRHFSHSKIEAPRILFKTGSFPDPNRWHGDFNSLSPETIRFLHQNGVCLVGIDTPSVDPCDDEYLATHKEIYSLDMAILEGLVLKSVGSGLYSIIALPLKIKGADASPVRAILLEGVVFA